MSKCLVVFSGGQDSTTCLYWAKHNFDRVHAVTFDYGQRHALEVNASSIIAEMSCIDAYDVVSVPGILRGSSPLTDQSATLETYSDYESMDKTIGNRVELTFVPMRNALFLSIAANIAISKGIYDIVTGVCQQDNANYPDCREGFITSQQATINAALGVSNFKIHTPLMHLSKAESIRLASSMPGCMDALAFSHTCYAGKFPPCGKCHSCVLRAEGFRVAGVDDPLIVRSRQS